MLVRPHGVRSQSAPLSAPRGSRAGPGRGRQRAEHAQSGAQGARGRGFVRRGRRAARAHRRRAGSRGRGRAPPGTCAPHPPRQRRCLSRARRWARGARCPLATRRSLRTGRGRCAIAGGRGHARAASRAALFVRRKARPSGSGSTRRHFLARSRHRLARSLPPDRD